MKRTAEISDPCSIGHVLAIIGGKWKGPIIFWLHSEPRRFNELRRLLPAISPRVLTVQLRQLECDGVICHESAEELNGQARYVLTPLGNDLIPLLDAIKEWRRRHLHPFN